MIYQGPRVMWLVFWETKLKIAPIVKNLVTGSNFFNNIKPLSTYKMSKSNETWESAKKKYQDMNIDDKRTLYRTKQYYTIENLAVWPEYCEQNSPLLENLPLLVDHKIDHSLNNRLADKITVFRGDITHLEVDVIVNAANSSLLGGGGVDGAIHRAAGHLLKDECRTLGGCKVGEAKLTGGYKLPAKHVIHTVGPQGEKPGALKMCYKNCMEIALNKNLQTVAFPCISTGIYGYPLEPAAHIAAMEVRKQLEANPDKFTRIIFCLFAEIDENIYQRILQSYFPLK